MFAPFRAVALHLSLLDVAALAAALALRGARRRPAASDRATLRPFVFSFGATIATATRPLA